MPFSQPETSNSTCRPRFSEARQVVADILVETLDSGPRNPVESLSSEELRSACRVEDGPNRLRVKFHSTSIGEGEEATFLELECDADSQQMWVGMLHVAPSARRCGVGKRLAVAAEQIGRRLGMGRVCVLPYPEADAFWRRLGYHFQRGTSRIRAKQL